MTRLVVFDLDGTLVDSRRDLADSANALLVSCGCDPLPEEAIGRMVGDGAAALVARAFTASGCPQPADALQRFLAMYDDRLLMFTRPYPDMEHVLDQLAARAALAVLTNKPLAATRRLLNGLHLAKYFAPERVLGGDGPSPRKPDPAGLRHLMDQAAVDREATVMVGDSVIDWKTARAAGTRACLVGYGFGFASVPVEEVEADVALVSTPRELLTVL